MKRLKRYLAEIAPFIGKATFVFGLVLFMAFVSFSLLVRLEREYENDSDKRTLSVEAEASRTVQPDIAIITMGSNLRGSSDLISTQDEASKSINEAIEKIKELGIPENKIKTSTFDISRSYDNEEDEEIYVIRFEIIVEIEDISPQSEKVGNVIEAGIDSGLNELRNLRFDISNREAIIEELKLEAIEKAKEKKNSVAEASGVKLGDVYDIYFGGGYYPLFERQYNNESMISDAPSLNEDIQISTGENELRTSVTVEFEIL
jgi:hypothetical protein